MNRISSPMPSSTARRARTSSSIQARPSAPSQRRSISVGLRSPTLRSTSCSSSAIAGPTAVGEALQLELEVGEHAGVEQLAQLLGAQQVAEQVAVERQRGRTAFGQRCVALVHVGRDPVEQQALGERRRLGGVDGDDAHRPAAQLGEHLAQRRQVEHVLHALARRLEQDREARVLRRHRQQVGGALTLLPQRRAPVGTTARQQQRTRRALAEPGREQRGLRQRRQHQLVDVVGIDDQLLDRQLVGRLGQSEHDAVVAPHRLDRHVEAVHQPALDRHRPRCVHRRAERAEDAHAPVADLVAEALDHDGAIVGDHAGGLGLLLEVHAARCSRRARRAGSRPLSCASASRRVEGADLALRTRRGPGPARAAAPAGRRARTASCRAARAPG